ncbi:hypothetical protein FIBSPDRAFT_953242 [Athelia psychrophila]|uniref:Uncharacterized protein n=1 Tax=Athelia psychrophila TaxID=1759441 RepID=A0A166KHC4_9AGAM|nr:hypothetical protein FIBSPDRAFT_953242 [Fibularhizoctonia sp. CBS 109695]
MPKFWSTVLGRLRSTHSSREFSPYEIVTPTVPGYSFGALLTSAIDRPDEEDASDYEDGASDDDMADGDFEDCALFVYRIEYASSNPCAAHGEASS